MVAMPCAPHAPEGSCSTLGETFLRNRRHPAAISAGPHVTTRCWERSDVRKVSNGFPDFVVQNLYRETCNGRSGFKHDLALARDEMAFPFAGTLSGWIQILCVPRRRTDRGASPPEKASSGISAFKRGVSRIQT